MIEKIKKFFGRSSKEEEKDIYQRIEDEYHKECLWRPENIHRVWIANSSNHSYVEAIFLGIEEVFEYTSMLKFRYPDGYEIRLEVRTCYLGDSIGNCPIIYNFASYYNGYESSYAIIRDKSTLDKWASEQKNLLKDLIEDKESKLKIELAWKKFEEAPNLERYLEWLALSKKEEHSDLIQNLTTEIESLKELERKL